MKLVDLGKAEILLGRIACALEDSAQELKQIRNLLEPQAQGSGTGFRAGYADPDSNPDSAWIGSTDEVRNALKEQIEAFHGRPMTTEEEREYGFSDEPEAVHVAFERIKNARREGSSSEPPTSIDGFSREAVQAGPGVEVPSER